MWSHEVDRTPKGAGSPVLLIGTPRPLPPSASAQNAFPVPLGLLPSPSLTRMVTRSGAGGVGLVPHLMPEPIYHFVVEVVSRDAPKAALNFAEFQLFLCIMADYCCALNQNNNHGSESQRLAAKVESLLNHLASWSLKSATANKKTKRKTLFLLLNRRFCDIVRIHIFWWQ